METYYGYIRTPADAIKLFEACRRGVLPRIQRRLSEKERQLIRSGSVFVWDEREAGMRRWTDGKSWSASRVSGSFLSYREMEGKRGGRLMSPPLSLKQTTGASPDSGLNSDEDIDHEEPDGYRYKPNGLIKQSFSIKTSTGRHLHLISYFSRTATSNAVELCQPTTDPQLRHIKLVKGMYPDVTSHESQGSMNIRALVPASPFTQLHPAHVEHVGTSKSSQETLGRPYQLSHSPEYQWPSSPTMISPLTSSFTGTAHSISPLQSPHHSNTPSTPSFNSSSPHVLHRPLESYQLQTAHVFNHPAKRKSGSLSPSQSVVNHAHLLSLRSRENSSTAKTLEQQGSLSIHTFNSSTESVAELNSISDPDHPEPIQDTRKAPILSSPLPDLNPKNAGNGLSNLNPRSTPVFKPLLETSLAANHSSRSDLSNRISLKRLNLPWNINHAVDCIIPPITNLTLFTESISQSNCSNTSEHLGTTAPKYWERLSFKGRDMRCEVLREQSNFIGEDQRAIRVLNRKFCV